ncbi:hypothetical protein ABIC28_003140 [Rhodococcus sp. PvR044]|uniref:hypothetical protein n=1 Tax=unclassified Rhodococcus (in: high G+C Gram-positive bacteria) TaxID=192944 RepID=UPI000BD2BC4B|nr:MULTISPECIES: hypothetical protein [unclassified Rhodococcus (in: high G+C Gram-positive bacteria)]PTR45073.1 hypothetical protein C8K38_102213 [Rhodococcus sp. OK611]SNX89408.1 hypothetical protein SAMN05447004_102213 [Rhodococcus sp. OK270]
MSEADPIMTGIMAAQELANGGDRAGARAAFATLWERTGPDGDPLHAVTIAHYMADVQDEPADELDWDLRALEAADSLTDERAQRHHSSLQVAGFYPSLHLNLAADYAKLGEDDRARAHLELAEACVSTLSDDGYGATVRGGIARLRERLSQAG